MTSAEVFDRAITRYGCGPRLDRNRRAGTTAGQVYDGIAQQAEELIASAKQSLPRLPHIHFDFVYNGTVNAFAFKENDQYFIGITSGTFVLLQLIFCRMLSDARLLKHAGNPENEASSLPPLAGLIPDADKLVAAGVTICRPKTDSRWLYSCDLLSQAALFMIGHEIAHITRGHVDYLGSKTGVAILPEIWRSKPNQNGLLDKLDMQVLEGDADQRSFLARLGSIDLINRTSGLDTPPWLNTPPGIEQMLFDCAFAVSSLCRLFGDIRFAGADLTADEYPPWPMRRAILMFFALEYAKNAWDSSIKEVAETVLRSATMEVEAGFATITGESKSGRGLDDALSQEGKAHMMLLAERWFGGLRDRVAPFAYEDIMQNPRGFPEAAPST